MNTLSSFTRLSNLLMLGPRGELGPVTGKTFQVDTTLTNMFATYTARYLNEYAARLDDHRFRIGLIYQSRQPKAWGTETLLFTDAVVRMLYPLSGASQSGLTTFQQKKRENSIYYGIELLLEYVLKDSPGVPIFLPVLYDRGATLGEYSNFPRDLLANEDPATPTIEVLNLIGPASTSRKNVDAFVAVKQRISDAFVRKDARKSVESKIMESMRAPRAAVPESPEPSATTIAPSGDAPAITETLSADNSSQRWYSPTLHDSTCEKLRRHLLQPREYAAVEDIRSFIRFRELSMSQQKGLANSCPVYAAPPSSVLLEPNTTDQWNLYLLRGDLQLTAADGGTKTVSGGTDAARNAVAALKPRKFTVTASSRVQFLWIHESIIAEIQQRERGSQLELVP